MKAIVLQNSDGSRHLAFVVPSDFNTHAWAQTRRESFRLLRVVRVIEE